MTPTMGDNLDDYLASGLPIVALSGIAVIVVVVGVCVRFAKWALLRWT